MNKSRFNVRHAVLSIAFAVAAAILVSSVHSWQVYRHADEQYRIAEQSVEANDQEAFLGALDRYLSFDPKNREIRAQYGMALAERAKNNRDRWRALQVLRQAIGDKTNLPEERVQAAELALTLREYDQALKYLEPLIRIQPERVELRLLAARCEIARGKPEEATASLRTVLELEPGHAEAAALLASLYRERGQNKPARSVLDRLVKQNPRSAEAYLARARFAVNDNRLEDVVADLVEVEKCSGPVVKLSKRALDVQVDAAMLLAEIEAFRQQTEEAERAWQRVIALAPDRVSGYLGLSQSLKLRGENAAALEILRKAKQKVPDHVEVLFRLADMLLDENHADEAKKLQRALVKIAPGRGCFLTARLAQRGNRPLEAIENYIKALDSGELGREVAGRAHFELSRCYAALGGRREELQSLENSVGLSSAPLPKRILAERLVALRRYDEALPLLRALVRQSPSMRSAWAVLSRTLIEKSRGVPRGERNYAEIVEAIDHTAFDPTLEVTRALLFADLYELKEEPSQAKRVLEIAREDHPKDPTIQAALLGLAQRSGDRTLLQSLIEKGDQTLRDNPVWLATRIERLKAMRDDDIYREMARLESRVRTLPEDEQEALLRLLAQVHLSQENHRDAERLVAGLLVSRPGDLDLRVLLIESRIQRGAMAGAAREVEQVEKLEGADGAVWRYGRALLLLQAKAKPEDVVRARRLLGEAQKTRPAWSQPVWQLAQLDDQEGKADQALAGYRRLLDLGDYRPEAVKRTVEILQEKKLWQEALVVCDKALQQGVLSPDLQRVASRIALKAEKPARACEYALLVVHENSKSASDQIWLGEILDAAGRRTVAREAFARAIGLEPESAEPYLALIAHFTLHRERDEAAEILEEMKLALGAEKAPMAVARGQEIMGRLDLAIETYQTILNEKPNLREALRGIADLLILENLPLRAEPFLKTLLDPKIGVPERQVPELRRRLALVLTAPEQKADRVDEALALVALNRSGEQEADRRVRALVLGRRPGRRKEALASLTGNRTGWTLQERIRLAQLHDLAGNDKLSQDVLLEALQTNPQSSSTMAVLIDELIRHEQWVEAKSWIDRLEKREGGSERVAAMRKRLEDGKK